MARFERPYRQSHGDRDREDRGRDDSGPRDDGHEDADRGSLFSRDPGEIERRRYRGRDPFDPRESPFDRDDSEGDPDRPPLQREGRRFSEFEDWEQPREISPEDAGRRVEPNQGEDDDELRS